MHHIIRRRHTRLTLLAGSAVLVLAGCQGRPLDIDLRGLGGGFSTAEAASTSVAARPKPDSRGVISYPNYQVAVARQGDTLADVGRRVGLDSGELARYNGIDPKVPLRQNEIIALPRRVAEPSAATGAGKPVDITSLADGAINRSPATPSVQTSALPSTTPAPAPTAAPAPAPQPTAAPQPQQEPIRHRVERGETAYTIARLYNVPVKALAEWNGLGPDFAIRDGQFLLIPVAEQAAPRRSPATGGASSAPTPAAAPATTLPGTGSPTPTPPSAAKPLPQNEAPAATVEQPPEKPVADVGKPTQPVSSAKFVTPVTGSVIRGYSKGKNEGINIKAADGTAVKAADAGVVAAITKSADGVPIIVVRHPDNLLTVYANVTGVAVKKGDSVARGQAIAKLRTGDDAYVHFEVRKGFDSVDPSPYLD